MYKLLPFHSLHYIHRNLQNISLYFTKQTLKTVCGLRGCFLPIVLDAWCHLQLAYVVG